MHTLIRIVPRTTYTSPTGASAQFEIVLAKRIPTAAFVSAVAIVRVHANPATAAWAVVFQNSSLTEDEPNTVFFTATGETSVAIPNAATPNLVVQSITTPIADSMRVLLRSPPAGGPGNSLTLSIDLVGRDA